MVEIIIVQLLIIISFLSSGFCHAYFQMSENNLKLPILCLWKVKWFIIANTH